jgi:hypothetical protein
MEYTRFGVNETAWLLHPASKVCRCHTHRRNTKRIVLIMVFSLRQETAGAGMGFDPFPIVFFLTYFRSLV